MSNSDTSNFPKVAILGAGLVGRLLALSLKDSVNVELFDQDDGSGEHSAAYLAAAMLAPLSESADATKEVMQLGEWALTRWPSLLKKLDTTVFFQQTGSLVVAFEQDMGNLDQFKQRLKGDDFQAVSEAQIQDLEPELNPRLTRGVYLPHEGQLDNRALLASLRQTLDNSEQVIWHHNACITRSGQFVLNNGQSLDLSDFDWVIDCRGFGQKSEQNQHNKAKSSTIPNLRGVRGEVLRLQAPDVQLNRPVRLMHPRYPIYITPKENGIFVVGATQIETEDDRQPTVRSALELLSACFSVHSGFAEAEILEIASGIRPAYLDNEPKIVIQDKVININGLFRHGFLLAPAMVDACLGGMNIQDECAKKNQVRLNEVLERMPRLMDDESAQNAKNRGGGE
ncbi:Glycine oxidase ThiO [hydrothermal vent metagenome]|uniref:Glycine oxidase ThiO n=1 Tax=hydrothermal vent metagenome TaxID=652676 RepID=A0A3B0WLZ2_9ZZZZ